MQVLKDKINNDIQKAAKELFLKKGYSNVSMREISTKANVGLSNMYNYFKSKDELFQAIVEPALSVFENILEHQKKNAFIDVYEIKTEKFLHEYIAKYLEFIKSYRTELTILLFKSRGSSLQNFKEEFTNQATVQIKEAFIQRQKLNEGINLDISDFTIHLHSVWKFTLLEEIIKYKVPSGELEKIINEYVRFEVNGWRELIEI